MAKLKKAEFRDIVKAYYEDRTEGTITNKELEPFIEDVFLAIKEALLEGNDVPLGDIGTLKVKDVAARIGRNPSTGEEIEIKATRKVSFTQSKSLKETFKGE